MADAVRKLEDLPALRALADPVRLRVIDLLAAEPRTVKELAAVLGIPRTRLHYHVNVLEKHGLVRVASTRVVNGATERRYEPSGRTFDARHLPIPAAVAAGVAGVLETAAQAVDARLRTRQPGRTAVGTGHLRITEAQQTELSARIQALIEEYEDAPADDGSPVTVVFALYGDGG